MAGKVRFRTRAERLSPEKRRAQRISSAIRVFAAKGIGHTNHAAVAAEADISASAVFSYFPSREELTTAVVNEVAEFYRARIIRPILTENPASRSLEDMLLAFCDSIDTDRDMARVWLDWGTAIRSQTWPLWLKFQKEARLHVRNALKLGKAAGLVRDGISIDEAAELVVNMGHVIAQMKFTGASRARIRRTVRIVLQAILVHEA